MNRLRHTFWLLPAALLACTPCIGGGQRPQEANILRAALRAQLVGFGGCEPAVQRLPRPQGFNVDLRFMEGVCGLEHGGTGRALAAVGPDGQVFQLSSRAGFAFMIAMHPSPPVDSVAVVEYAALAAQMQSGRNSVLRLVGESSEVSDTLLREVGAIRTQLWKRSRVLSTLPDGYEVGLNLVGEREVATLTVLVYARNGMAEIITEHHWVVEQ